MRELSYFSTRSRFGRAHPYDIEVPLFWWKGHYDVHFLNTLYRIDEEEFSEFYTYHLYISEKRTTMPMKAFFFANWVQDRREYMKQVRQDAWIQP